MNPLQQTPLQRTVAAELSEQTRLFPCVLVTGARQVGKSTLLRDHLPEGMGYVTLDDLLTYSEATSDPVGFLDKHPAPLCIDEVQYFPDILRAIKVRIDADRCAGMYWLTGSQRFHLMKGVSESLAGRMGIIELSTFSQREAVGQGGRQTPLFSLETLPELLEGAPLCGRDDLLQRIVRGGYPELIVQPELTAHRFFSAYVQTYIERDVQDLSQVSDKGAFFRLLRSAAARTGQQVNYSSLARDAGVSSKTAKAWVDLLVTSGIVTLLEPYAATTTKRLVKSPKLYLADTGLACWLNGIEDASSLERSPLLGAMVETWAFGQLWRNLTDHGIRPRLSYYRDSRGAEVDFLLEHRGALTPVEVKWSATPVLNDLKAALTIPAGFLPLTPGIVLYAGTELRHLGHGCYAMPLSGI